jgi:hypothetical protein
MADDRVDKSQYKEVVAREKKKLVKQVIVLTVFAAVVAGGFLVAVLNANPYTK